MEIYLRRNVVDPFLDVGIPNKANWKTGTSNRNSEEFVAMILLLSRPGLRNTISHHWRITLILHVKLTFVFPLPLGSLGWGNKLSTIETSSLTFLKESR